ncbi:MAG: M15 family metallopeptidase [Clostridia bacterium]|nr:M15 family metallopeptidase [Clostridia bacterium]
MADIERTDNIIDKERAERKEKREKQKKTRRIIIAICVVLAIGVSCGFFYDFFLDDSNPLQIVSVSDGEGGPGGGKSTGELSPTTAGEVISDENIPDLTDDAGNTAEPANTPEETAQNLTDISDTSASETVYYDTPYIPAGGDETVQLVNKVCGVSKNYKPANLQLTKYRATDRAEANQYMVDYAANAMDAMIEGAMAEGYTVLVTTAYRSYSFQSTLYNNYVAKDGQAAADKYSARPGTSEHQTGLAADLTSATVGYKLTKDFGGTAEGQWLSAHAHEYGFILRYTSAGEPITGYMYEPWHFRYVGVDNATYIHQKGITLEEFIAEKY